MNFKTSSSTLKQAHSFLSPSKYHWVNYTPERLKEVYLSYRKAALGTRIHSFAEECISLSQRLPNTTASLNNFVNDAIGFRMSPEVTLYFSDNAFGTVDAISFDSDVLRIHDLKTGVSPSSMTQLEIYAALFCLEYSINPINISIVLRIYQNDEVDEMFPDPSSIQNIMDTITRFDMIIESLKDV